MVLGEVDDGQATAVALDELHEGAVIDAPGISEVEGHRAIDIDRDGHREETVSIAFVEITGDPELGSSELGTPCTRDDRHHAILLFCIPHLELVAAGMSGAPRRVSSTTRQLDLGNSRCGSEVPAPPRSTVDRRNGDILRR